MDNQQTASQEAALLPLPESIAYLWLEHGEAVNAFHGHGLAELPREAWDHDGFWTEKGFSRAPLYTANQMQEYARAALSTQKGGGEPVAWLVTGGRTFVDRAYTSEDQAMRSRDERKDGARVVPLYPPKAGDASGPAPAQAVQPMIDADKLQREIMNLLWGEHLECCGSPVVGYGGEYMGQREEVLSCCGCPEPALLTDAQIVASLRSMFPENGRHAAAELVSDALGGVRPVEAQSRQRDCTWCAGRGFYGTPGKRCEWCDGKGKVLAPPNADAPAVPPAADEQENGRG